MSEVSAVINSDFGVSEEGRSESQVQVTVNATLASQFELLSSEKKTVETEMRTILFRLENISGDDSLINFYTGFMSYELFMAFFAFLGPATSHLKYWGSKGKGQRKRKMKLDPLNH